MSTKVKISEAQFDKALYAVLSESNILVEGEHANQLNKGDVEQIAKKTIKTYFDSGRSAELENRIKSVVTQMVKSDKNIQDSIVEITRNVLVQLYKALWTKKSFWTSDLKNSSN